MKRSALVDMIFTIANADLDSLIDSLQIENQRDSSLSVFFTYIEVSELTMLYYEYNIVVLRQNGKGRTNVKRAAFRVQRFRMHTLQ